MLMSLSVPAFARDLPEPETFALVAAGLIAAIAVSRIKRK
ncbi:MAG: PEP-CTERM sorting domain-containing protein [Burkholderiales bacterium]|nr:PEP-CTERM sorting domain-containing protein [Burkholderiales bacterium]